MSEHHELLQTIARRCDSLLATTNYTAERLDGLIRFVERRPHGMVRVAGIVLNQTTGAIMAVSQGALIPLTNAAVPAQATRFLAVIDIAGGTTLPTVVSSNPALLQVVAATALNDQNQFVWGAYPIGTGAETNDNVSVTTSLLGQPDIVENFAISGQPVTPETDTLDPSSAVGTWEGAPNVPATPI